MSQWQILLMSGGAAVAGVVLATLAGQWRLARALRRQRAAERDAAAARRLADLGAMTAGLAHEIKNPLSTLGLNAQLLNEAVEDLDVDPDDRASLTRRADTLVRESERLRDILGDFLEFAREPGLELAPGDLNAVVDELVDFFLPQAERSGVRLRADLSSEPLMARLDAPHLKQAVLNLLLNATQAMSDTPEGAPRELILRTGSGKDEADKPVRELHIIDTGPGIERDKLTRIFEPYFTTKSGGTGLGLPTTRRLIEAHGGRIEAHSEPGRGTDFVVILPAIETD